MRAVPALVKSFARDVESLVPPPRSDLSSLELKLSHAVEGDRFSWDCGADRPETHALLAIGTPGAVALAARLDTTPALAREWAFGILARMDPPPIATLGKLLEHADVRLRHRALDVLAGLEDRAGDVAPHLARALMRDEDVDGLRTSVDSVRFVRNMWRHDAVDLLVRSTNASVVRPALERFLDDADLQVRAASAAGLGKRGNEESVAPLSAALEREGRRLNALDRASLPGEPELCVRLSLFVESALKSLTALGKRAEVAIPILVDILSGPDTVGPDSVDTPTSSLVFALAEVATDDDVLRALASSDPHTRRCGAWVVEARLSCPPHVISALITRLDDADDTVRSAAASAHVSEKDAWLPSTSRASSRPRRARSRQGDAPPAIGAYSCSPSWRSATRRRAKR